VTIPSFTRMTHTLEALFLAVLPHGGQGSARKNAWASMVEDNNRAKSRREADVAMSRAQDLWSRTASAR
jgi:hypothetical protein